MNPISFEEYKFLPFEERVKVVQDHEDRLKAIQDQKDMVAAMDLFESMGVRIVTKHSVLLLL